MAQFAPRLAVFIQPPIQAPVVCGEPQRDPGIQRIKTLPRPENLSHVTNALYKEGIFVQILWTYSNKTNNFQCCQQHTLIRVLPEDTLVQNRLL